MPYPHEHAARFADPKQFKRYARKNSEFGPGIDAIYGISGGKSHLQAIRFRSNRYSIKEVRAWLKSHGKSPILLEAARTGKSAKKALAHSLSKRPHR